MKMVIRAKAGFTLVEIMIVVALIGLLASIALPSIVRARTQSQAYTCINNLRKIDDASQQWGLEYLKMPDSTVTFPDIQPYLKNSIVCPCGGVNATFDSSYTLTTISNKPVCKILPATHVLQPDTSS